MSKNLHNCFEKLNFICSIKDEFLRKKILETLSNECLYKALREIAINYNKGNIKLDPKSVRLMKRYNRQLKELTNKNNKRGTKIKLIKQSGGWLPIIIPAVASIITSLLNK